jgi:hypothetical protein
MSNLATTKKHTVTEPSNADKWRFTLYTTVLLLILFNPWMYKLVHRLLSFLIGPIANKEGCPTMLGFIVHAIVFTVILRLLMR